MLQCYGTRIAQVEKHGDPIADTARQGINLKVRKHALVSGSKVQHSRISIFLYESWMWCLPTRHLTKACMSRQKKRKKVVSFTVDASASSQLRRRTGKGPKKCMGAGRRVTAARQAMRRKRPVAHRERTARGQAAATASSSCS